jgi:hypothetical protein
MSEMVDPARREEQRDGWSRRRTKKAARLARIATLMRGQFLETGSIVEALQSLLEPGDAVALEGDNQKQADFLSRSLAQADPAKIHDLHLLISSVSRPEHMTLFDRGIARKIDFAYAEPQSFVLLRRGGCLHVVSLGLILLARNRLYSCLGRTWLLWQEFAQPLQDYHSFVPTSQLRSHREYHLPGPILTPRTRKYF